LQPACVDQALLCARTDACCLPRTQGNIAAARRTGASGAVAEQRDCRRLAELQKELEQARERLATAMKSRECERAAEYAVNVAALQDTYDALKQYTLREHGAGWLALSFVPNFLLGDEVLSDAAAAGAKRRSSDETGAP